MMKKVMATILTCVICVTVLTGCGKSNPIQEDLINYINNQLPTVVELENKISTEYEANTGDNFTDDPTLAAKLKNVIIPASDELLAKTKTIVPVTEEVLKVHSKYIAVVAEQNEAFNLLLQAAQKSDTKLVTTANEKLRDADKVSKEYLSDIQDLKKEYKIVNGK